MLGNQTQYAVHRKKLGLPGGSRRAVQKALEAQRIHAEPDGRIDFEMADAEWAANTDPMKAHAVHKSANLSAPVESSRPKESVAAQQFELLQEKTLTARTKRLQLQGEVIAVADVEQAVGEMIDTAKNLLLLIPDTRADQLAASKDPAECRSILEHDIREALQAISLKLATP